MGVNYSFCGRAEHQLDDKGRVRIPSKFFPKREDGEDDGKGYAMKFYFMPGTQGCISVYLKDALDARLEKKLRNVENDTAESVKSKRKILSSIELVETDKQGRAVIPNTLRTSAKIVKDLITVGMDDHFEIWAKEQYDLVNGDMTFAQAYSMVGFF